VHFVLADKYSPDTARFVYHCYWNSLWVEISTLAYEVNTLLTRKVVSGVLCPYNSDKSNAKKIGDIHKIDVYSYSRAHRCVSCSAGVICRGCVVVTCNTHPSIYTKNILGTLE